MLLSLKEPEYLKLEMEMDLNEGMNSYIHSHTTSAFRKGLQIQEAWQRVAPNTMLDHTDNVVMSKKKSGAIVVFVDSPHCAAELSMSKEYIRQMMEHELGYPVTDIFFIVSKNTGIRKSFTKQEQEIPWYKDESKPIPLDEKELAYVRMSVEGIEDEKLKESLFNAFVNDMEWKKGIKAAKMPNTKN